MYGKRIWNELLRHPVYNLISKSHSTFLFQITYSCSQGNYSNLYPTFELIMQIKNPKKIRANRPLFSSYDYFTESSSYDKILRKKRNNKFELEISPTTGLMVPTDTLGLHEFRPADFSSQTFGPARKSGIFRAIP